MGDSPAMKVEEGVLEKLRGEREGAFWLVGCLETD
eukprot:CAMPEP_0197493348 /NCGR_PEP_ID=MMETSP1311-20131121/21278_1 /TAXON_ID=464262 /ORGANISM="Genus nov. species nov., Strain RCC856" /LENGTH=34 /DNA_ID= /DNA_START= /DNA_END= /DNA_ORIENTATION=